MTYDGSEMSAVSQSVSHLVMDKGACIELHKNSTPPVIEYIQAMHPPAATLPSLAP